MDKSYGQRLVKMRIILSLYFLGILIYLHPADAYGYSMSDATTLYDVLKKNQSKYIRGRLNQNEPTLIIAEFNILSLNDLDELSGKLSLNGYFQMGWVDERMTWDYMKHGAVPSIRFPQTEVWTPLVVLGNAYAGMKALGFDFLPVEFYSDGTALWLPGDQFECRCQVDLTKFPFDTQNCYLQFVPYHTTVHEVFFNLSAFISSGYFVENGVWEIMDVRVETTVDDAGPQILFIHLKLLRRSQFYLINMIMPIFLMGILNIFVFLLPPRFGDRVGYSVSVLLSIAVFQTIASDSLPNTSYPGVPVLSMKLLADLVCSCVITVLTIIVLRVYNIDSERPIPKLTQKITFFLIHHSKFRRNLKHFISKKENQVQEIHVNPVDQSSINDNTINDNFALQEFNVSWRDVGKVMDMFMAMCSILLFSVSNMTYMIYIKQSA